MSEAHLLGLLLAYLVTQDRADAVSGPISLTSYVERILPSIAPSVSKGLKDNWGAKRAWLLLTPTWVTVSHMEFSDARV